VPNGSLYNRLPARITEYLINIDAREKLEHFTERRLRSLPLLVSDDDEIRKFDEIEEALAKGRISANLC